MIDRRRPSSSAGWLEEVCPEPLQARIRGALAAGEVLEPLLAQWAGSVSGLVTTVEVAIGQAASGDDQFEALAEIVGLNALTGLVERIGEACRRAGESDCLD